MSELNGASIVASRALRIPEIAAMIIAELANDKTTLVSCAQVCSLWAAEATSLLWQNANLPSALVKYMELDRIQFYAGKISSLDIILDSSWRRFFSAAEFPRLSKIRITEAHDRPTTREDAISLHTAHPVVPRASLESLKFRYPIIRKLSEHGHVPTGPDAALLSFLTDIPAIHLPDLRDVVLCLRSRHAATKALFCALAVSSGLTELEFPLLDASFVRSAEAITAHPFSHLRYLMCSGDGEVLTNLIPHLRALEVANLVTWGDPPNLLVPFTQLTNLQELIVRHVCLPDYVDQMFYTEHILEIGRCCKKLLRLHLEDPVNDGEPDTSCDINDDDIDQLLSTMPQLQHLCLKFANYHMSSDIFDIIGRRCRDLRSLSIGGEWHLSVILSMTEENCLFPCLQVLEVESFDDEGSYALAPGYEFSPDRFFETLKQQCPQLEELSCEHNATVLTCEEEWSADWPFVARTKLAHRNVSLAAFLPRDMASHGYYWDVMI